MELTAFEEMLVLTSRLHGEIRAGRSDGECADAIRDEMDGFKCTQEQNQEIGRISDAMYLPEDPPDIDELAEAEHYSWSGWMKYLHPILLKDLEEMLTNLPLAPDWRPQVLTGFFEMPSVKKYIRQMNTPYEHLSEKEQESDRIEARKKLKVYRPHLGIVAMKLAAAVDDELEGLGDQVQDIFIRLCQGALPELDEGPEVNQKYRHLIGFARGVHEISKDKGLGSRLQSVDFAPSEVQAEHLDNLLEYLGTMAVQGASWATPEDPEGPPDLEDALERLAKAGQDYLSSAGEPDYEERVHEESGKIHNSFPVKGRPLGGRVERLEKILDHLEPEMDRIEARLNRCMSVKDIDIRFPLEMKIHPIHDNSRGGDDPPIKYYQAWANIGPPDRSYWCSPIAEGDTEEEAVRNARDMAEYLGFKQVAYLINCYLVENFPSEET